MYNAPREMVVGTEPYTIVFALDPRGTTSAIEVETREQVLSQLHKHLAVQMSDPLETVFEAWTENMSAELLAPPDWQIRPTGEVPRTVRLDRRTIWEWQVTPSCSRRKFSNRCAPAELVVKVKLYEAGDVLFEFTRVIPVSTTQATKAGQWISDIWHTPIGRLVLGLGCMATVLSLAMITKRRWPQRRDPQVHILFLAANPAETGRLRLDEEVRAVDESIRKATHRDHFSVTQRWAVRPEELREFLLRDRPTIVHFSGHGSKAGGLVLEPPSQPSGSSSPLSPAPISAEYLGELFGLLKGGVRCVVLNACHSDEQAKAIAAHVDCVIGMSREISDTAAERFAGAFYSALAYGESLQKAFDLGCLEAGQVSLLAELTPRIESRNANPAEIFFVKSDTTHDASDPPKRNERKARHE